MAGYDLMKAGRSPAEIRRLKKRRERMGAPIEDRSVSVKKTSTAAPIEDHSVPKKVAKKKVATKAKFGVGSSKTITHNGRSMANVTGDQLKKTGLKSTAAYMRRWKELGTRPTKATAAGAKRTAAETARRREVATAAVSELRAKRKKRNAPAADAKKVVKPKATTTVKPTTTTTVKPTTTADRITAQGRRNNERAQLTAPSAKRTAAEIARRRKVADAARKKYIEVNLAFQRDPEARDIWQSELGAYRRNKRNAPPSTQPQRMADSTSRTSPLRDMMFKKGGVVKAPKALKGGKGRDGIAERGFTKANRK
jgi:hypothetical protein|tara:strand:+ start:63 stop:992 length:930 start_codon:yes stop_codon:yes gene_type:complete